MEQLQDKRKEEIFNELKTIIIDKLNVDEKEVTADKTLKDLSADSLDSVELIMECEKHWNMAIPDPDMEKFTNIQSIVNYIFDHTSAPQPAV